MNYLVCAINMKYYQHSKKMVPVLSHIIFLTTPKVNSLNLTVNSNTVNINSL